MATELPPSTAATAAVAAYEQKKTKTAPSEVLFIYGLTLMIIGALAFAAADYESKAKSALFIGNGSAIVCFILAFGTKKHLSVKKGESGFKLYMAAIHFALMFPVLMITVISWRLSLAWSVPAKAYIRPYFIAIIVSSFMAFAALYSFKPKKSKDNDTMSTSTEIASTDQEQQEQQVLSANDADLSSSSMKSEQRDAQNSDTIQTPLSGSSRKSSSTDKSHKPQVVRRRPRRAQAM